MLGQNFVHRRLHERRVRLLKDAFRNRLSEQFEQQHSPLNFYCKALAYMAIAGAATELLEHPLIGDSLVKQLVTLGRAYSIDKKKLTQRLAEPALSHRVRLAVNMMDAQRRAPASLAA